MFFDGRTNKGGVLSTAVQKAVESSRASGVLNLRGYDIDQVPAAVYNPKSIDSNWWEVAELVQVFLSFNQIATLPSQVGNILSITVLDVSHNCLETLPPSLSQLYHLRSLDVSHNQIRELPLELEQLSSLVQFSCVNNQLTFLPSGFGRNQPHLVKLFLSENKLQALPEGLACCSFLRVLDVEKNCIQAIALHTLTGLVDVNLGNNKLSGTLPADIGDLQQMQVLNIRYNHLTHLPREISRCRSLVELHAGFNRLMGLPAEMGELRALKVLDLCTNSISNIPAPACQMQLTLLDLSNNNLVTLPPELGLMTTLKKLPLEGNPLRRIRRELITGPTASLLQALQLRIPDASSPPLPRPVNAIHHTPAPSWSFGQEESESSTEMARRLSVGHRGRILNLRRTDLAEVPQQVWDTMPFLEKLDMSDNKIQDIPLDVFHEAFHLQKLLLENTGLTKWPLPAKDGFLPSLIELSVARNPIPEIPADAFTGCLGTLRDLDLSGLVAVARMPEGVLASLKKLQRLSLQRTQLREIPAELLTMTSLTTLDLSDNTLSTVPESLTQLTNLQVLNLTNNSIVNVPPQIGLMHPTLRTIMLEGNILKRLRRHVLESGTSSVLRYLRDRIPI